MFDLGYGARWLPLILAHPAAWPDGHVLRRIARAQGPAPSGAFRLIFRLASSWNDPGIAAGPARWRDGPHGPPAGKPRRDRGGRPRRGRRAEARARPEPSDRRRVRPAGRADSDGCSSGARVHRRVRRMGDRQGARPGNGWARSRSARGRLHLAGRRAPVRGGAVLARPAGTETGGAGVDGHGAREQDRPRLRGAFLAAQAGHARLRGRPRDVVLAGVLRRIPERRRRR